MIEWEATPFESNFENLFGLRFKTISSNNLFQAFIFLTENYCFKRNYVSLFRKKPVHYAFRLKFFCGLGCEAVKNFMHRCVILII